MKLSEYRFWLTTLGLALMLALVCFGSGLHAKPFGDDYLYLVHAVATDPFWFFTHANPLHIYAFRPIEFMFIWYTQVLLPGDTLLLHGSQLAIHVSVAFLITYFMRKLECGKGESILAGLYFLVSQSAVHAVVSNDTISQQFETLFGCASLFFLHKSVSTSPKLGLPQLGISVGLFGLTLLGKELGMSLLATFGLYLGYRTFLGKIRPREALIAFLPNLLLALAYMAVRKHMGLPSGGFGERTIDFHIGSNLLVNPILAMVQAAMPFSSVDVYLAMKTRDFAHLILPALGAGAVLGMPALGLYLSGRLRLGLELAALFFSSICIAFLMNHISELYVYSAMPFFAAYFAIGILALGQKLPTPARMAAATAVVAVVLANVMASRAKTDMMVELGERAAILAPQVERVMAAAPRNSKIGLVNPVKETTYSVFRQEGFIAVSDWPHAYKVLHKREDLGLSIVGADPEPIKKDSTISYFSYDRDFRVRPYSFQGAPN